MGATIRDVSKLAGVSVATVSRVLNGSGYVSKEAEQAVRSAMETLQYNPSPIARSLAGKLTSSVALLVPDILNPFFPALARAIEDTAQPLGISVLLCNTDHDSSKERHYLTMLAGKQIDGILLASYSAKPEELLEYERSRGIPVILVDGCFPGYPLAAFVAKHREGARLAAGHLLAQGCRKIAHIAGPEHIYAAGERLRGYEDMCRGQSWFTPSLIVPGDFQVSGGERATHELLHRHPEVDGIFAGNDRMAIGALRALYTKGIAVPGQVKVIGFDGIAAGGTVPELSTVAQPIYEMGKLAMEHLLARLRGEAVPAGIHELQVELQAGGTS